MRQTQRPRWLYRRGRRDEALAALAANNGEEKAKDILAEMIAADEAEAAEKAALAAAAKGDTLFQRKYAWRIPGMGEPGGQPSMGSHRVGHD